VVAFVDDLDLVYTGHITNFGFDLTASGGAVASINTTDASSDLDKSLVDDFYPADFVIVSLRGKPRPQLWGRAYSIAPVIEDEADLIYRVARNALDDVLEVRVGGVPWRRRTGPGRRGEQHQITSRQGQGTRLLYGCRRCRLLTAPALR
jgi:hypothetical protein